MTGADPEIGQSDGHRAGRPTRPCCRSWSAAWTTRASWSAELALRRSSLDEVFLSLTGHRAEESDDDAGEGADATVTREGTTGMTAITAARRARAGRRVSPAHRACANALTLAWRSLVQIKHNPMELLDLSIQPIMFVLLFTYVFGGAISGSPGDYLQFALPGIIVQNAIFATLTTGVGLNTDLTKGVFDRLRSLPIARWSPLAGRILADTVKQAWSMALLLGVGMLLGFRLHERLLGAARRVRAAAGLLAGRVLDSVLVGVLVSEPEKVQIFGFMVIFPLTFTSNAFVPTATMPGWLQAWVKVNPVTILADALRGLLIGGPVAAPTVQSLLWAVAIAAIFAPLAMRALKRRL